MWRVRVGFVLVAVAALVVLGGCGSAGSPLSNRFGDCTFDPNARCANQDLVAVNIPSTDLTGADFSGSDLRRADLRYTILRNVNFSGTNLSNANLTGADLRGANLANAQLFQSTLDRADWTGANRAGTRYCETLLPDGSVSDCREITDLEVPVVTAKPPVVVNFGPRPPVQCFNDGAGEGIEVDWLLRDATSAGFLVDDIQASSALGSSGITRIPFPCDRRTHKVTIQAFGAVPPLAAASFSLTLGPGSLSEPVR